ncbi:MAG: transcription antitermination factor NusB [Clostridia bacterium]|nr:transcription antitermination factor NusB [Clostridia bacterium]
MSRKAARENALKIIYNCALMKEEPEDVCEYFEETHKDEAEMWAEEMSKNDVEYMRRLAFGAAEKKDELNAKIAPLLKKWTPERLPKMNLAILQLAVYEIDNIDDVPYSVSVNEAVELAKLYAEEEAYKFINGALAVYLKQKAEIKD